jgi:hypothetical protein
MRRINSIFSAFAVVILAGSVVVRADIIFETHDPFGGPFGITGFDVSSGQSVAARFEPDGEHSLDRIRLWLWNNDENGREPQIDIKLETDDSATGESRPSGVVLESWTFNVPGSGVFNPILYVFESASHVAIHGGQRYWITARSPAPPGGNPVWAWAALDSGFMSLIDHASTDQWSNAASGAVASYIVEGTPSGGTPGDIDGDGDVDLSDLAIFLSVFGLCEGAPGFVPAADINGDGCIDLADLTILLSNFGS